MSSAPNFTDRAQSSLTVAVQLAKDFAHAQITPAHLALALLTDKANIGTADPLFKSVLSKSGVDPANFENILRKALQKIPQQSPPPDDVGLSGLTAKLLKAADTLRSNQHDSFVAQDHLLLALLDDSSIQNYLKEAGLANTQLVKTALSQARGDKRIDSKTAEEGFEALDKYCIDLTALASEGKLDPVIGRDNEIRRTVRVLSRRTKNNVVLIGEPGVGKTAVCEGLAQRIVDRDVPPNLMGRLLSLDMGALMSGAKYRGEYEERVKGVLDEIEKASQSGQQIILFIDEMHLIMTGEGGEAGMSAANLLKPALARGKLRCIGATTLNEYRKHIEKDSAFERRFQQVMVSEPTVPDTIAILRGLRERYEVHHAVRILDSSIVQAATLAKRYLTARRLPDSAIDLIDEACADVRVSRDTVPEDIDKLERKKTSLQVAIHALEREKDGSSKEQLEATKKELAALEEELGPALAAFQAEKEKGEELNNVRKKIDEIKAKADEAERRFDLATTADLRYYALPDLEEKYRRLQAEERARAEKGEGENTKNAVTPEAIATIVARWTGIPVTRMLESEKSKLLKLDRILARTVVGQPEAVSAVAQAIRLSRSGLSNPNQPIASFLFCGPSGTGKTLTCKALARELFDDEQAMLRIDASEYSEKHSVSRLLGAPPGYVGYEAGGTLTEFIRRKPFSVILVDELEKAAKEFVTLWLQILDDGRATDGQGRVVDFKNTIVIFTSNLGAAYLNESSSGSSEDGMPHDETAITPATRALVEGAIAAHLPPEFRNRLSATIIFRKLSRSDVRGIVDLRLREVQQRLTANGKRMKLDVSDAAKDFLASTGYNPAMGARPLQRTIQNELLAQLSILILRGQIQDGETVRVEFLQHENRLRVVPNHESAPGLWNDDDDDEMDEDLEGDYDGARIEADPLD